MSDQGKTKRQLQAEQTKIQIFDAAMRLLEKQDFDSITVRDIVREAKVSIGSFYNYYQSKLDVFYATYQISDHYFDTVVRSHLTQPTARERILYFFREYAVYSSETSIFALTKVLYNANNTFFHRSSANGMLSILTELIAQAVAQGEFRTDQTPEQLAEFFMICMRGVAYDWCTCNGSYDLKARMDEYMQLLLRAFQ